MSISLVQRLRFDATRCEVTFSKGVACNIEEAADKIEQLEREVLDRGKVEYAQRQEIERLTEKLNAAQLDLAAFTNSQ